jgi:hypothetical protein
MYLLPLLQVLPSGFLCLLGSLSITLASLQSLLLSLLLLGFLLLLLVLCLLLLGSAQWLSSSRSTSLLGGSSGLLIGLDPLDSGIVGENIINKLSESGRIILLSPCSFRLVLFLGESLLISTTISAHALRSWTRGHTNQIPHWPLCRAIRKTSNCQSCTKHRRILRLPSWKHRFHRKQAWAGSWRTWPLEQRWVRWSRSISRRE